MNQRFQNSLINDPNLNIQISLTGILFLNNQTDTPWTNASLSVPDAPINNRTNKNGNNDSFFKEDPDK